jgi:class 3 adenylate cyclase
VRRSGIFRDAGPRTRRLAAFLKKRSRTARERRPALDCETFPRLFRKHAVVFTDTDDFTIQVARHGILHFLMLFDRLIAAAAPEITRAGGEIVKVEGDSLLLRFDDVGAACAGIDAIEASLRRVNRGRPQYERLAFSYGVGFGDILDLEADLFGLEVNLASKLGEDMAKRGEVLLTPAAAASLPKPCLRRVVPHRVVTFEGRAIPIQRLRLGRER